MKTKPLFLTALVALTALAALAPAPAAADIRFQDPCETVRCENIPVGCIVTRGGDATEDPTTVTCYAYACQYCYCQGVSGTYDVEAAGQEASGWWGASCGVAVSITYTPAPADPAAPVCYWTTVNAGPLRPMLESLLGAIYLGTPIPHCAQADCNFPASPVGGAVGEAYDYATQVATIWCNAAQEVASEAQDAVATAEAYVVGQVQETNDFFCEQFCMTMQASICDLNCYVAKIPSWITVYAAAMRDVVGDQATGQLNLLCAFAVGAENCNSGAPEGTCAADIPREDGGLAGDVESYAGSACDSADGGADGTTDATGTALFQAVAWFRVTVDQVGDDVNARLDATTEFAGDRVYDAAAYASSTLGTATDVADTITTATIATCTATTTFVSGGTCPV